MVRQRVLTFDETSSLWRGYEGMRKQRQYVKALELFEECVEGLSRADDSRFHDGRDTLGYMPSVVLQTRHIYLAAGADDVDALQSCITLSRKPSLVKLKGQLGEDVLLRVAQMTVLLWKKLRSEKTVMWPGDFSDVRSSVRRYGPYILHWAVRLGFISETDHAYSLVVDPRSAGLEQGPPEAPRPVATNRFMDAHEPVSPVLVLPGPSFKEEIYTPSRGEVLPQEVEIVGTSGKDRLHGKRLAHVVFTFHVRRQYDFPGQFFRFVFTDGAGRRYEYTPDFPIRQFWPSLDGRSIVIAAREPFLLVITEYGEEQDVFDLRSWNLLTYARAREDAFHAGNPSWQDVPFPEWTDVRSVDYNEVIGRFVMCIQDLVVLVSREGRVGGIYRLPGYVDDANKYRPVFSSQQAENSQLYPRLNISLEFDDQGHKKVSPPKVVSRALKHILSNDRGGIVVEDALHDRFTFGIKGLRVLARLPKDYRES